MDGHEIGVAVAGAADLSPKAAQHPLRMIAGDPWFAHFGYAVRIQARQENARLHLGRGMWRLLGDGAQVAAAGECERQTFAVGGLIRDAHV